MREVELGEIASYQNGYAFKPEDWSKNGLPIIRIQNLNDPDKDYNHYEGDDIDERYFVQDGDVLIAWSASLGVYVWNRGDAWLNQHTFKVNFENDEVDKSYFVYAIQEVLKKIENKLHGSTMKHITKKKFLKLKIPLPSLSEQKAIVAKLDRAQRLINIDKEMLAKYDELIQSVFLEMFGDTYVNEKAFDQKALSEMVDKNRGISYGVVQRGKHIEDGVPLIRIKDVKKGDFDVANLVRTSKENSNKYSRTILEGGEYLISIRGTVGEIAVVPSYAKGWNITREVAIIPLTYNIDRTYFYYYLKTEGTMKKLLGNVKGVAQRGINLKDLRKLRISIPPKSLQLKFANKIQEIDRLKKFTKKSLSKSEELFSSLVQGAFG